jgi:hypothetical protein
MTQSNPDIEILGTSILYHPAKKELFDHGKTWIMKHWEKEGRPVTKIHVAGKTIGRNIGFIMDVSISNPEATVKYFAKIQRAHLDTVLIHYLLKYTNSGPDVFLIVPVKNHMRDGRYGEGVITMEVPNFKMASAISPTDLALLRAKPKFLHTQFFLVTLLSELCDFAAIPYNRDNWGYASDPKSENVVDTLQRLVLVDFSTIYGISRHLYSKRGFLYKMEQNYDDFSGFDFTGASLKKQVKQFPWLQSAAAFTAVLQRAMHSTERWLQDLHSADPVSITAIESMDSVCGTSRESLSGASQSSVSSGTALPNEGDLITGAAQLEGTPSSGTSNAIDTAATATVSSITTSATTASAAAATTPVSASAITPTIATIPDFSTLSAAQTDILAVSPHIHALCATSPYYVQALVNEYTEWVERWNGQCDKMFKWMPFPRRPKVKYSVQVGVVKVKSHLRRRQAAYRYRM